MQSGKHEMIAGLGPLDIRAAAAVAVCYFTSARPGECRCLRWEDSRDNQLYTKRGIWRHHVGETKTQVSAATVPVIEPLKGLLASVECPRELPLLGGNRPQLFARSLAEALQRIDPGPALH